MIIIVTTLPLKIAIGKLKYLMAKQLLLKSTRQTTYLKNIFYLK